VGRQKLDFFSPATRNRRKCFIFGRNRSNFRPITFGGKKLSKLDQKSAENDLFLMVKPYFFGPGPPKNVMFLVVHIVYPSLLGSEEDVTMLKVWLMHDVDSTHQLVFASRSGFSRFQ
jgi:hypothetical protein